MNQAPTARERGGWSNLDEYRPGQEIVAWASETHGLDATDPEFLNDWKDYCRAQDEVPADLDASYRRWLRKEKRYQDSGQRRPRREKSTARQRKQAGSMIEAAIDKVAKRGRSYEQRRRAAKQIKRRKTDRAV